MGGSISHAARADIEAAIASSQAPQQRVNFVCVNVGPAYPMAYVEILRDMVLRNASNMEAPCAWFCLTDRPDELPEGVNAIPAPDDLPGWWAKVALFSPDMPWDRGDRIVYFDLDVAITGRLEDLVERKGIIRDWGWPCYNSSVMVWDHGEHSEVWDLFDPTIQTRSPGPLISEALPPKDQINGGDQEWITEIGGWTPFPADWCVSYRMHAQAWPPNASKVVVFHGQPKPADITEGWVPNVWKVGGYTSLPEMKGANTTQDFRLANVRSSVQRDLEWFTGFKDEGKSIAIVCGAPSMRNCLSDIRAQRRRGVRIVSVNNAWRYLTENGVKPDVHVMLDARAENVEFVRDAPEGIRYCIASQCHPDVFDALKDREVVLWHNAVGDGEEMREILAPWWDEGPNQKPCILVPGGSTVGLRALWLAHFSGFKTIHVYGMDSSYADDGSHHAYAQPLNDGEEILEAALGDKRYACAKWMLRQAEEFRTTWFDLKAEGVTIHVHGTGLVPDIARLLRQEARAA